MRSVNNTTEIVFDLIDLLQTREFVTVRDISNSLGICYASAKKYLDCASLHMPIYEDGYDKRTLRPAIKYKLMGGKKCTK